jgi:two-component system, OmpR family, response regulator
MLNALIIDDEIDICYLLSGLLKNRNLKPAYVNTLSEATLAMREQAPYIVFIDNHLPDGKGSDYISYIKKMYPDTKIVMITAHDTLDDKNKALRMGADSFIGKPFSSATVYRTIQELSN